MGKDRGGVRDRDRLAITVVDCRKYQKNLLTGAYQDKPVRCHVWVAPVDADGINWRVASFQDEKPGEGRKRWRRSKELVTDVKIVAGEYPAFPPNGARWNEVTPHWMPDNEGPSQVYIEFDVDTETSGRKRFEQIVPLDFLPGAFFCAIDVGNVGTWMVLSVVIGLICFVLVVGDCVLQLRHFIGGSEFDDCTEVIQGRCWVPLNQAGAIDVTELRMSTGFQLAILGGIIILIDVCCLILIPSRQENDITINEKLITQFIPKC